MLLNMFSDWHKSDNRNRHIALRKSVLAVLKNVTNLSQSPQTTHTCTHWCSLHRHTGPSSAGSNVFYTIDTLAITLSLILTYPKPNPNRNHNPWGRWNNRLHRCQIVSVLNIIIIIRSRRQQRSVASTQSGHDDEPWTIQHEC